MSLYSGERQVSNGLVPNDAFSIKGIRRDHTARYYWANSFIRKGDCVLDACCGIGYGSHTMAISNFPKVVVAFDRDEETIEFAKKWYQLPNIEYHCFDVEEITFDEKVFDKIVCFEAIEHVDRPLHLLYDFHESLKDDGILIMSTPNGRVFPFDKEKFPEHKLHYTPELLEAQLNTAGFKVDQWLSQPHKFSMNMSNNLEGKFMLLVASKL